MNSVQKSKPNASLMEGLKGFLSWLPEDDVMAILKTSTGGLIYASSKKDAISIILRYSDAVSVLNRRRVRKDVLAAYLHHENVQFRLPTDKTTLCRVCLTTWGHENVQAYQFLDGLSNPSDEAIRSPENIGILGSSNVIRAARTPSNSPNPHVQEDTMEVEYNTNQELLKQEALAGQELAMKFTEWFFEKWNKLEDFVDSHFWPECNLRMEIVNQGSNPACKEVLNDGSSCCEEMRGLIRIEGLFFNPNLGSGVRGKINPHGLAQVVVCGSVHRNSQVIGVFETMFGLVKDPLAQNNYKLKFVVLRFRASSAICNTELPAVTSNGSIVNEDE